MKVHIFDSETKEYLRTEDASKEPLGGEFVRTSNSTFISPFDADEVPENMAQIFDAENDKWNLVYDYRGKWIIELNTSKAKIISTLGGLKDNEVLLPLEYVEEYCSKPDYFTVSTVGVIRKSDEEIEAIDTVEDQERVRGRRNDLLSDTDWRIQRVEDALKLKIECIDDIMDLVRYRQFLRDYTKNENWWKQDMPTFEEFLKL